MARAGSASRPSERPAGSLVLASPIGFVATAESKLVPEQVPTQAKANNAVGVSRPEAPACSKSISEKMHD